MRGFPCARQCLAPPPSVLHVGPLHRSKQRIAMYTASGNGQLRILRTNSSTFGVILHNQKLLHGEGNLLLCVDGRRRYVYGHVRSESNTAFRESMRCEAVQSPQRSTT